MLVPAPFRYRDQVGLPESYYIHQPYEVRLDNKAFDDTPFTDEFQKEVYQYARQLAERYGFRSVLDIGCGSGFKLITNFFDRDTVGLELPDTLEFLEKKWPGRKWGTAGLLYHDFAFELVISSDVIEHLVDPNELLKQIQLYRPKRIVLSTPERDELCFGTHDGPPRNMHHVREWNFAEFHAYIGSWFQIREHFVINGCQIVDCSL